MSTDQVQKKFLEDKEATDVEIQKTRESLVQGEKLIEVTENHFKVLKRLKE